MIRSDEEGISEINKFRDIGNIGNFSKQKEDFGIKLSGAQSQNIKKYEEAHFEENNDDYTAKGPKKVNKYYPSLSDIENHQQT